MVAGETPVEPHPGKPWPAQADWLASQRRWALGWRRLILPGLFLVYLLYVIGPIGEYSSGAAAVVGYVLLAAFAVCFLAITKYGAEADPRRYRGMYGALVAIFLAELWFAHDAAFVLCIYIGVVTVARLGVRAAPAIAAMTLAALLVPPAVPAWHDGLATGLENVTVIAIPLLALVTFGILQVYEGNRELSAARVEIARLAAENERIRIARDLHDLLGHSLTTITLKAGLARRLGATDPARALREIAEVEALGRSSVADVRAAVGNYREVTLAGELATGRELLRAAGIAAELPAAVDSVDPSHQELFGWAVREGLTNVVRHARATTCAVRVATASVEIVDDGVGGTRQAGNGLSGLRERVAASGGVVEAGPLQPRGWRLCVRLEPEAGVR